MSKRPTNTNRRGEIEDILERDTLEKGKFTSFILEAREKPLDRVEDGNITDTILKKIELQRSQYNLDI